MPLWRLTAGRAHAFSYFVVVPAESFKLTRRLPRYHFTRSAAGFQHHVRKVRVQRAIERYAGDRGAGECRRGYPMGQATSPRGRAGTAAALMVAVSFTVAFCLARWISESIFGFRQSREYPGSQCRMPHAESKARRDCRSPKTKKPTILELNQGLRPRATRTSSRRGRP
jgi:hypothetical protein